MKRDDNIKTRFSNIRASSSDQVSPWDIYEEYSERYICQTKIHRSGLVEAQELAIVGPVDVPAVVRPLYIDENKIVISSCRGNGGEEERTTYVTESSITVPREFTRFSPVDLVSAAHNEKRRVSTAIAEKWLLSNTHPTVPPI